ncbi:hypothetical protein Bca52824_057744 [Brassica carinata]|uniref:Uncharacterized protein n=1 Tax=Brassica carinata TaxID=52824 RepID=A0A8X7UE28_BRACI|nr:hypothetical protein Bca52824_057744 [Brassica carinata]
MGTDPGARFLRGLRLLGVYFSPLWCLFFLSSVEVGWSVRISPPHNFVSGLLTLFGDVSPVKINVVVSSQSNFSGAIRGIYSFGISPPHNFVSGLLTLFGDVSPVKINVVVSSQSNFSGAIRGIYSFGEAIPNHVSGPISTEESISVRGKGGTQGGRVKCVDSDKVLPKDYAEQLEARPSREVTGPTTYELALGTDPGCSLDMEATD